VLVTLGAARGLVARQADSGSGPLDRSMQRTGYLFILPWVLGSSRSRLARWSSRCC
jgi:hypothetical protein